METNKPKSGGLMWVLILIILLVLGAAVFFGYKIIFPSDGGQVSEDTEEDTQEEGQDEDIVGEEDAGDEDEVAEEDEEELADDCVQNPAPAGWTAVDNTYAGYTAYRPGWYYRIFSPGSMLGMGPGPIPTESEYAGDIVIILHTLSQAAAETEFTDRLEAGYTSSTVTAGCREWVVYEGTEPANELFDAKEAKAAFVTVDGDVYSVEMSVAAASFASTEAKFDILIDIMVFN